jgi:hypothetical protein
MASLNSGSGAYWRVTDAQLPALATQIRATDRWLLTDEASYRRLMDRFGVRRTAELFWEHSDKIMQAHHAADTVDNA